MWIHFAYSLKARQSLAMSDRHSISPYPIRMPPELRELLEASARDGSRSLHAEIISRLWSTFQDYEPVKELPEISSAINKEKLLASLDRTPDEDPDAEEGLRVIKRNGQIINYTDDAITRAIIRAFEAVEGGLYKGNGNSGGKGPKPRKRFPAK